MSDLPRASELLSYWTQLTPREAAEAIAKVLEAERKRGRSQADGETAEKLRRLARAHAGVVRPASDVYNAIADELEGAP